MRERKDIEKFALMALGNAGEVPNSSHASLLMMVVETNLDCRDLLQQLVEKKSRKVVTTEVTLSEKESALLNSLDTIDA